jgi:GNAT superfamily N-acetyltransferase
MTQAPVILSQIKLSEITDVASREFQEALEIYNDSFPSNERHMEDVIIDRFQKKLYRIFVVHSGNQVAGMAILYSLSGGDFVLFDYMAVKKEFRGKGIGGDLVKAMIQYVQAEAKKKYLILEVENPEYGNNKNERLARIRFYRKLGIKQLKQVRYILPPLQGTIPTEMILMVAPEYPGRILKGTLVKKIMTQLYRELYNRNENDKLLQSFLNDVPEVVELI